MLFELALCNMLARARDRAQGPQKALYLAPLKALVGQRFADWKDKFGSLGITCAPMHSPYLVAHDMQAARLAVTLTTSLTS